MKLEVERVIVFRAEISAAALTEGHLHL